MSRFKPVLFGVIAAGTVVVATAQPRTEATRRERQLDTALMVRPDPRMFSVAAMGFDELVCDVLWLRAVLTFGDRYDRDASVEWREWLGGMLEAAVELDPKWNTLYQYGGAMLRVAGDIDGSTAVFKRCSDELPDNAWCPFSVGMNYYLYKQDSSVAADWIAKAAIRPGAPAWWASAAGKMKTAAGGAATALHFIEDQLAADPPEAQRAYLEAERGRLIHELVVAAWTPACKAYFADTGRRLPAPEAVTQLGFKFGPNPRGDAWVVGGDGVVRGESAEAERVHQVQAAERAIAAPLPAP